MKKLILIAALAVAFTGCKSSSCPAYWNDTIKVKPAKRAKLQKCPAFKVKPLPINPNFKR